VVIPYASGPSVLNLQFITNPTLPSMAWISLISGTIQKFNIAASKNLINYDQMSIIN